MRWNVYAGTRSWRRRCISSVRCFDHVNPASKDPITSVTEAFLADSNPNKINLGVVFCFFLNNIFQMWESVLLVTESRSILLFGFRELTGTMKENRSCFNVCTRRRRGLQGASFCKCLIVSNC